MFVLFSPTTNRQTFDREVLVYTRHFGEHVVPVVGVYSTRKDLFALIFGFMEHLNLGEYLRNNRNAGRFDLVRVHLSPQSLS